MSRDQYERVKNHIEQHEKPDSLRKRMILQSRYQVTSGTSVAESELRSNPLLKDDVLEMQAAEIFDKLVNDALGEDFHELWNQFEDAVMNSIGNVNFHNVSTLMAKIKERLPV